MVLCGLVARKAWRVFDGHAYRFYRHDDTNPNSLPDNYVIDVLIDSRGILWVTTRRGGVARYRPETDDFVIYHGVSDIENRIPLNVMFEDDEYRLWVGGLGGVLFYDENADQFNRWLGDDLNTDSISRYRIHDIEQWRSGELVFSTEQGVFTWKIFSDYTTRYRHIPGDPDSLDDNDVRTLMKDRWGRLWVGSRHGVSTFNPETGVFHIGVRS